MKLVKMAAAALNQTPLAWQHNRDNILAVLDEARSAGVSILCLPEMCITGYGCEDAYHSPGLQRTALSTLVDLVPQTKGMVVSLGLPIYHRKALYNCACLLVDGAIVGFVAKKFMAGDGVHYEPRWFKPWPSGVRSEIEIAGKSYPLGDLVFDCGGLRIGFEICEDAWVANRPGSDLALRGVDVILNPSASHFAFDKFEVRKRFVIEGSRAFAVAYVYANLIGNEAGRIVYDGGALIASAGALRAQGERFSFAERILTTTVVDVDENRVDQVRRGSHTPRYDESDEGVVQVRFSWPKVAPSPRPAPVDPRASSAASPSWESSPHIHHEEFSRAVALGLFDYLRKSRSRGFVISLSGGADSAACAVLCALAVELAVRELGLDVVKERLAHIPGVAEASDVRSVCQQLILCVYQATENSSETTFEAARVVADAIGAEFMRFDVDALVAGYVGMVSQAMGREIRWDTDDVALQNIQARVRGPGVWMLANLRQSLLLATSNRSEAAVGYATMDGDTCGGISPIAGIDKAFLRAWLSFMEHHGPSGLAPVPALSAVNVQAPTAELRPAEAEQTDEGDLMPYPLLDAIEDAAIGRKLTPTEVYAEMHAVFPQYPPLQLGKWVERFFRLWCRNQWKRERYAPSFHLDDKNLDPKTWCRFPILSGGYERELQGLLAHVIKTADQES